MLNTISDRERKYIMKYETREKLKHVKDGIMGRCYNPNNAKYKNYGGRGVTADQRWRKIDTFVEDITQLDGWNEEQFLAGNLVLYKDIKVRGNKLYDKEHCLWVTPKENSQVKPSYQKDMIGVHVTGYTEEFFNMQRFADKHNIKRQSIQIVLQKGRKYDSNWYFYYKGNTPKYPTVYRAYNPITKEEHIAFKQSEVEREIGASSGTVFKCLRRKNNTYKGWTITAYTLSENK